MAPSSPLVQLCPLSWKNLLAKKVRESAIFLPRAIAMITISSVSLVERFDINELQNWPEFSLEISDGDQSGTGLLLLVVLKRK